MKKTICLFVLLSLLTGCKTLHKTTAARLPLWMQGEFVDDYGIEYTINDSLLKQHSVALYHIVESNAAEQYLVAENDSSNVYSKGMYTRIDYMPFARMEPYTWGYCLTVYDAPDVATAKNATPANRAEPKKGCNGYPFSRMKKK